jgi:uncharacterized protein YjdB
MEVGLMKTKVTFTIVLLISTIFIGCPNPTGPDISSTVAVTGVTLDKSSITLLTSATEQLTATVEPGNADNKNVSWASDDEAVAEVDSSGLVTGVGVGTTIVRVTTEDGGKIDECSVTV